MVRETLAALDDRGRRARGGHSRASKRMIDADHIVSGDGISWMRRYLGEDEPRRFAIPHIVSGFGLRVMGVRMPGTEGRDGRHHHLRRWAAPWAATSAPPRRSSAARASSSTFYDTGEELFERDVRAWKPSSEVQSFFIMDENFLLHRKRAHGAAGAHEGRPGRAGRSTSSPRPMPSASTRWRNWWSWAISWIWMGLESPRLAATRS